MTEEYEHKKLLEQYLLGLTSREEEVFVEKLLAEDERAAQEFEKLREQLDAYISQQGVSDLAPPARRRSSQDFHDLDHEMITQMTRRNHYLVIWRLALSAVCLVLLFVSGYLFRENQNYQLAVSREKALHAQDDASYRRQLEAMEGGEINWDSLETQTVNSEYGNVLVYHLTDAGTTFLDLSRLRKPGPEEIYYLLMTAPNGREELTRLDEPGRLKLVPVVERQGSVRVLRGRLDSVPPYDTSAAVTITDIALR